MKPLLKISIFLVASLFLFLNLSAQVKPINKSALDQKLDSVFKEFNNTSAPGYAITIQQNGKVITKKDYGLANMEFKVPFSHNYTLLRRSRIHLSGYSINGTGWKTYFGR